VNIGDLVKHKYSNRIGVLVKFVPIDLSRTHDFKAWELGRRAYVFWAQTGKLSLMPLPSIESLSAHINGDE